jgi:hypothetical protein
MRPCTESEFRCRNGFCIKVAFLKNQEARRVLVAKTFFSKKYLGKLEMRSGQRLRR